MVSSTSDPLTSNYGHLLLIGEAMRAGDLGWAIAQLFGYMAVVRRIGGEIFGVAMDGLKY